MFLDCANAYFEYLSKSFFHGLPTVLCKIVGVYQIGYHNRVTGKKTMEQIAVMQNIFYGRNVSKVFDLKGSIRGRQAKMIQTDKEKDQVDRNEMLKPPSNEFRAEMNTPTANSGCINASSQTLLDGDFLEFTGGAPMPLNDRFVFQSYPGTEKNLFMMMHRDRLITLIL
jgi:1-phosphatidylinositol-3-phosphate 5-kinase